MKNIHNITLSAMFMALGLVLPFVTGQIAVIGSMLLPMHLPVMLCGLICGWKYGLLVGFVLPLLRYFLFGMPPMPGCISMAFELATYGAVIGYAYEHARWKCMKTLMISLITAMIAGRVVWAVAQMAVLGLNGGAFTWKMFVAGAFVNALPGILLQLLLIPLIMTALNKTKIRTFDTPKVQQADSH